MKAYTKDYSGQDYNNNNNNNEEYMELYRNMLKSVYENGGFWIGRYEAGYEGEILRKSDIEITENDKAVIKRNTYPYNYVKKIY